MDPAHFEADIAGWFFQQDPSKIERLAADGIGLRGTGRGDGKPITLFSLVTHHLRTTFLSFIDSNGPAVEPGTPDFP